MSLRIAADPGAVADAAAATVVRALREAVNARGIASLMVCGGRTPVPLYRRLAATGREPSATRAPEWARIHVWFTDERAVPPDDSASNYRLVREALLEPAGVPAENVHRMPGEMADLDAAARGAEAELPRVLDVIVLGLGDDGHVASLFPGSPLLAERDRRVAPVLDAPQPSARRLTITPPVVERATSVVVLATGAGKAEALAMAFAPGDAVAVPARLARDREWYVDREAARRLPEAQGTGER